MAVHPRDPAAVEGAARSILAERQFRRPEPNLLVRFLDWLGRELSRLLPSGQVGGLQVPSWVGILILAVIVVVLAVVLWRSRALGRRRGRGHRTAAIHERVEDLGVASDEWLRRAAAAEDAGDWAEGVRCRYRAALAVLAASGAVVERVGRTAGSYRRRVAEAAPAAAGPFGEATDRFEQAWYGRAPAGPDDRDAMAALHAAIEVAAPEIGAGGADAAAAASGTRRS